MRPALNGGKVDIVARGKSINITDGEVVLQVGANVDAGRVGEGPLDDVKKPSIGRLQRPTGNGRHHVPVGPEAAVRRCHVENGRQLDAVVAGRYDEGHRGGIFVIGRHRDGHQLLVRADVLQAVAGACALVDRAADDEHP